MLVIPLYAKPCDDVGNHEYLTEDTSLCICMYLHEHVFARL